jgi:cysteinyl-tRNA synthetase
MLSAHYRSPINFSREQIEAANNSLKRLYTARDNLVFQRDHGEDRPLNKLETDFCDRVKEYEKKFDAAMDDDLNTADALGVIFEMVKDANVIVQPGCASEAADKALESLNALCEVLGLLSREKDDLTNEVRRMVEERAEARRNKDWKRSDELRDAIRAAGYILEDTKQGQKVRKNLDR